MQKCNIRHDACEAFQEKHGFDPGEVLLPEYMSDTASGPDSDGEETREIWLDRVWSLAEQGGLRRDGGATIREYIKPLYRSEPVSRSLFFHINEAHLFDFLQG